MANIIPAQAASQIFRSATNQKNKQINVASDVQNMAVALPVDVRMDITATTINAIV